MLNKRELALEPFGSKSGNHITPLLKQFLQEKPDETDIEEEEDSATEDLPVEDNQDEEAASDDEKSVAS